MSLCLRSSELLPGKQTDTSVPIVCHCQPPATEFVECAVMAPTGHVLARLHHFSVGTQGIGVLPGQDTPVFLWVVFASKLARKGLWSRSSRGVHRLIERTRGRCTVLRGRQCGLPLIVLLHLLQLGIQLGSAFAGGDGHGEVAVGRRHHRG